MNRHRFEWVVGQSCAYKYPDSQGEVCGLNYSASFHYNDDDHPYVDNRVRIEEPQQCGWEMQNLPGRTPEGVFPCLRYEADAVHHHDDPEVTMVMQYPVEEPFKEWLKSTPGAGVVFDVPAEDGGVGEGSWAYEGFPGASVGEPGGDPFEPLPPPTPAQTPGTAAHARWNLENGSPVVRGPWTVRQFYWSEDPESQRAALDVVSSLANVGEAFAFETWYRSTDQMLARITWGSLLGVPDEDLGRFVESWSV